MLQTIAAEIDTKGQVHLLESVHLSRPMRALVTILEEPIDAEAALLAEAVLARDWNRPEEDAAWAKL